MEGVTFKVTDDYLNYPSSGDEIYYDYTFRKGSTMEDHIRVSVGYVYNKNTDRATKIMVYISDEYESDGFYTSEVNLSKSEAEVVCKDIIEYLYSVKDYSDGRASRVLKSKYGLRMNW